MLARKTRWSLPTAGNVEPELFYHISFLLFFAPSTRTDIIPRIKAFYSTSEATKPYCPASSWSGQRYAHIFHLFSFVSIEVVKTERKGPTEKSPFQNSLSAHHNEEAVMFSCNSNQIRHSRGESLKCPVTSKLWGPCSGLRRLGLFDFLFFKLFSPVIERVLQVLVCPPGNINAAANALRDCWKSHMACSTGMLELIEIFVLFSIFKKNPFLNTVSVWGWQTSHCTRDAWL